jgi:hypothetical protein
MNADRILAGDPAQAPLPSRLADRVGPRGIRCPVEQSNGLTR